MVAALGKHVLTSKCHNGAAARTAVKGSSVKTELLMGVFAVTRLAPIPMATKIARFIILKICWICKVSRYATEPSIAWKFKNSYTMLKFAVEDSPIRDCLSLYIHPLPGSTDNVATNHIACAPADMATRKCRVILAPVPLVSDKLAYQRSTCDLMSREFEKRAAV